MDADDAVRVTRDLLFRKKLNAKRAVSSFTRPQKPHLQNLTGNAILILSSGGANSRVGGSLRLLG